MKAELLNPVIDATLGVVNTYVGVMPVKKGVYLKQTNESSREISAVIELCDGVDGALVLTLAHDSACEICQQMTGMEKTSVDTDVLDTVGELVNIITGQAKRALTDEGYTFKLGTPSIVLGKENPLTRAGHSPYIGVEFGLGDVKTFAVEVSLKPNT